MRIRPVFLSLCAVLILTACKSEEQVAGERAAINSKLPVGCSLVDLGEYDQINQVVAVICESRPSVSTNVEWTEMQGKTHKTFQSLTVSYPEVNL